MQPSTNFPPGSKYDAECKRAINNIYNSCVRNNQVDWFHTVSSRPDTLKFMLEQYFQMHPRSKAGKRPAPRLLQMKEAVVASTMVDRDDVGEMMHIDAFIYWAGKRKNLSMPEQQARLEFDRLSKLPSAVTDRGGPHEDRPLRVRVHTKSLLTYRNRLQRERGYDLGSRPIRNANQEDIDHAYRATLQNHEDVGAMSCSGSMRDLANTMMGSTSAEDTWQGTAAVMPDIAMLQRATEADEEEEASDEEPEEVGGQDDDQEDARSRVSGKSARGRASQEAAAAGTKRGRSAGSAEPPATTPKKKASGAGGAEGKWWDRDGSVSAANKALSGKANDYRVAIKSLIDTNSNLMKSMKGNDALVQLIKNDVAIVENRMKAVRHVLAESVEPTGASGTPVTTLKEYIVAVLQAQSQRRALWGFEGSCCGRARICRCKPLSVGRGSALEVLCRFGHH